MIHDLSKYSFDEFWSGVKNYNRTISPVIISRRKCGYSIAWLHHKGRNKHHFEYWEDCSGKEHIGVFIPYKYIVELICDRLSAGKTYIGKKWNSKEPLTCWKSKDRDDLIVKHPGSVEFVDIVLKKIYDDGVDAALRPAYLKSIYKDICIKYGIRR